MGGRVRWLGRGSRSWISRGVIGVRPSLLRAWRRSCFSGSRPPRVPRSLARTRQRSSIAASTRSYVLLRLEGRSVTIDRLESVLPPRHRDGYSMAELSKAAASLGLTLEGVRFAKGDRALDRPAIAFVKDAKGGHFTVLRPGRHHRHDGSSHRPAPCPMDYGLRPAPRLATLDGPDPPGSRPVARALRSALVNCRGLCSGRDILRLAA